MLIALRDGYDVILEGILSVKSYDKILNELFELHEGENYMYYFDIGFEETVRRHETKPNIHEFGEKDMKEWYPIAYRSNHELEKIIPESFTQEETVQFISDSSKLDVS